MSELTNLVIDYFKDKDKTLEEIVKDIDDLKINVVKQYLDQTDNDKVYVIKRSGNIEEYSSDKITRSIKNAADENNQQLTSSDVGIIIQDVEKSMKDKNRKVFRTYEIKDFVKSALVSEGYSKIKDSYVSYIQTYNR